MTEPTGREALLTAFDRLFDRAASKLNLDCSADERAAAKKYFTERYDDALQVMDQVQLPAIADGALEKMEAAIEELPRAYVAAQVATGPLAVHVQEAMRAIALRAAEQRVLEHLASRADDTYGGN
ncbi:MAG: hypothetical protein AB7V27_00950 [Candidatus Binatia bacterium]